MKQLSLMVNLNLCIGCNTCVVACRNYKELVDHDRAMPNEMSHYLRVESHYKGTYPNIAANTWVVPCQHCFEPECIVSCPEEAISKDPETGIVCIDKDSCTGCNAIPGILATEKLKTSPCKVNCPAHINVQGYVGLATKGKYQEALKLIKEENPFPAVCGRVCDHPCESACKRVEIDEDEPVAINAIERFVGDLDLDPSTRYVPEIKDKKEDKVAIIGSGPAGLTCAYYLAQEGYQITIFEKASELGGMLTAGIPSYRLPRDVIEAEIQIIRDMGVTMKTGVEIGKDVTIAQLRQEGFNAFFVAIGLQESKRLEIEGEDLADVYDGLDFLRKVNLGEPVTLGKRVVVIGGGNVAVDAVRAARRLGAEKTFIMYRRSHEEMPASAEEIEECQEEGIPINILTNPVRFIGENGRVKAIECMKMRLSEPDDSGRRKPEPIPGSEFTLEVDTAITAIGQEADWTCLTPECACKLTEQGTIYVDPLTLQSDDPNIFGGGDVVTGPRTVIEAIAAGKQAAISIDRYIRDADLREGRGKEWAMVDDVQKEKYDPAKRARMPRLEIEARVNNFDEVQKGFTEEMTVTEAKRCLSCGCSCIQACPYGVIQFHAEEGYSHKCDLCFDKIYKRELPVCVEVCQTDAITFGEYELIKQDGLDNGLTIVEKLSKESVLYVV